MLIYLIYSCNGKAEFSASLLQSSVSHDPSKIALPIFRLIIKLNTLYIFVETETLLFLNQDSLINRKFEEQHLFETENFCNILDVFICHFCSI